ncbi:MAG: hypothetical protein Fur0021_13510 [Candidatus Promineifilaceae bacterium]
MSAGAAPSPPVITLYLSSPHADHIPAGYGYAIAGCVLVSSHPLTELAHLRLPHFTLPGSPPLSAAAVTPSSLGGALVFAGIACLGGQQRHVTCQVTADVIWLASPTAGLAAISRRQPRITLFPPTHDEQTPLLATALILTLAQQGVFCFHASAVVAGDKLVAFLGESGQGKSTLAAYLAADWQPLVDDVLPLATAAAPVACLPFPQPLPHPIKTPSPIPLSAAYLLHEGNLSLSALPPTAAALALVRHTVAARLFPSDLLARHLDFCAQLAVAVPIKRLRYPRHHAALAAVRQALAADFC